MVKKNKKRPLEEYKESATRCYGHLGNEMPIMERAFKLINTEERLECLEKVYEESTQFTRFEKMREVFTQMLIEDDVDMENVLWSSSVAIEMIIYTINIFKCEKARAKASRKLDNKKR